MAQLIQHKRGVLEDLSGVTPNKGELLVVTGSSISALADGLVFVGNHSDLTSVNKILTGSSSPDLSSYDAGVNGLPFYNTTDKNLQILRQDGNLDVVLKHTKVDFGGSTILSGSLVSPNNNTITLAVGGGLSVSADADFTLNQNSDQTITISTDGSNIVSGSSQVFSDVSGDVSIASNGVASIGSGVIVNADINGSAAIDYSKINFNGSGIQSGSGDISAVSAGNGLTGGGTTGDVTLNIGQGDGISVTADAIAVDGTVLRTTGDGVVSGSSQITLSSVSGYNANEHFTQGNITTVGTVTTGNVDAILPSGVISGSSQVSLSGFSTSDLSEGTNQYYTNARVTAQVNDLGLISQSAQVTGIVNSQIDAAAAIDHTKIDFGGSGLTSGSLNLSIAGGTGTDTVTVGSDTFTFAGTANEIETAVTNNQVAIGIVTNPTLSGNVIITGDLTVNGDTVQTNVTTMNVEDNIINLNYGGSQTTGGLYVTDATGGNTTSGSLIWDGTNDYWKAGAKDSEARVILGNGTDTAGTITKFSADGVITDSIITESGTTVTISNDLILSGLTANSFLVANASKQLVSVTTSTDGDILVSDGAGNFSATNTIDGGSF